ncbi:MAG: hypothetical protein Hals2KO_28240 [Halioglobus sp.]
MGAFLIAVCLPIGLASTSAQAISLGGQNSGKKFDYEACGKIVEGKTKAADLDSILKGEPVTTGKQAGRFIRSYQYTKGGVLSGVGAFGISLGGNKATQFSCTVTHNSAGIVLTVDMQKVEVGSSGAGI